MSLTGSAELGELSEIADRLQDAALIAVSEELDALFAQHDDVHRQYVPADCYLCAYERGETRDFENE